MQSSKVSTNEPLLQICFSIGSLRLCDKGRQYSMVYSGVLSWAAPRFWLMETLPMDSESSSGESQDSPAQWQCQ